MTFDLQLFKKHLKEAEIVILENEIKGSVTYLTYGLEIKNKLYSLATNLLKEEYFLEINLSDIILKSDVQKLDSISPVSKKYFPIKGTNFMMAAGHEIPFYLFLKRYLKHCSVLVFPMRFFHFGSVFRFPKNTKFPFNLGERRSFLECYTIYKDEEDSEKYLNQAIRWNRNLIKNVLHIPSIEVERPLVTNKPFSQKTICVDSITPIGLTAITGMSYLHNDIFTRIFGVKYKNFLTNKNILVRSVHFGISDHLFFSYLLNSHDGRGFRLLNTLAPFQVSIISDNDMDNLYEETKLLIKYLKEKNYSYKMELVGHKKLNSCIEKNVTKGIPLIITILREGSGIAGSVFYRGDSVSQRIDSSNLKTIDLLLEKNDKEIIENFRQRELDSVVGCTSLTEVNDALFLGKVCRVYLQNSDDSVVDFESQITSGEVLGFAPGEAEGKDILTSKLVSTSAYISRRS